MLTQALALAAALICALPALAEPRRVVIIDGSAVYGHGSQGATIKIQVNLAPENEGKNLLITGTKTYPSGATAPIRESIPLEGLEGIFINTRGAHGVTSTRYGGIGGRGGDVEIHVTEEQVKYLSLISVDSRGGDGGDGESYRSSIRTASGRRRWIPGVSGANGSPGTVRYVVHRSDGQSTAYDGIFSLAISGFEVETLPSLPNSPSRYRLKNIVVTNYGPMPSPADIFITYDEGGNNSSTAMLTYSLNERESAQAQGHIDFSMNDDTKELRLNTVIHGPGLPLPVSHISLRVAYDLRIENFELVPEDDDGILEMGEVLTARGITVQNLGNIPTPRDSIIEINTGHSAGLEPLSESLRIPQSVAAGASITLPGELRFRVLRNDAVTLFSQLKNEGHPHTSAKKKNYRLGSALSASGIAGIKAMAPGETARFTISVTNNTNRGLGANSPTGRHLSVGVALANGDSPAEERGPYHWQEIPLLGAGKSTEIPLHITMPATARAQPTLAASINLQASSQDAPAPIIRAQHPLTFVNGYRKSETDSILLVVNNRTKPKAIERWRDAARKLNLGLDLWDLSFYGHLAVKKKLMSGTSLQENYKDTLVVFIAGGKDNFLLPVVESQVIEALGAGALSLYVEGSDVDELTTLLDWHSQAGLAAKDHWRLRTSLDMTDTFPSAEMVILQGLPTAQIARTIRAAPAKQRAELIGKLPRERLSDLINFSIENPKAGPPLSFTVSTLSEEVLNEFLPVAAAEMLLLREATREKAVLNDLTQQVLATILAKRFAPTIAAALGDGWIRGASRRDIREALAPIDDYLGAFPKNKNNRPFVHLLQILKGAFKDTAALWEFITPERRGPWVRGEGLQIIKRHQSGLPVAPAAKLSHGGDGRIRHLVEDPTILATTAPDPSDVPAAHREGRAAARREYFRAFAAPLSPYLTHTDRCVGALSRDVSGDGPYR